jgi:hypothetical protein
MAIEVCSGGDQNFESHCETIAEADLIARRGGIELAVLESLARKWRISARNQRFRNAGQSNDQRKF